MSSNYIYAQSYKISEQIENLKNTKDIYEAVYIKFNIASAYQNQQAYQKAIEYYNEVENDITNHHLDFDLIYLFKNIAFCYEEMGLYEKAKKYLTIVLKEQQFEDDSTKSIEYINKTINKIVSLDLKLRNYEEAINNLKLLETNYEQNNDLIGLTSVYNNLALIYKKNNDDIRSKAYFNKCYYIVKFDKNSSLNDDKKATILLNLGVVNLELNEHESAYKYLKESYDIRVQQNNSTEIARVRNYLSLYFYIKGDFNQAYGQVKNAIDINKNNTDLESENILLNSYTIICEILISLNRYDKFKLYYKELEKLREEMMVKEKKQNQLLLEHQLNIEKKENELKILQSEKEKNILALKQAELEKDKSKSELLLKNKELDLLKRNKEIQEINLRNNSLENERIQQQLLLAKEKAKTLEQRQQMNSLQKDNELQELSLQKKQNELKLLQVEKEKKELQLSNAQKVRNYSLYLVGLFFLLMVAIVIFFVQNRSKNKILSYKNKVIELKNTQLNRQFEEITEVNEAINEKSKLLAVQNERLIEAQEIIKSQNENLEKTIAIRTKELTESNLQMTKYISQLEQFAYILSHNIRSPIARMIGLVNVLNETEVDKTTEKFILEKIVVSAKDLDQVIIDLNTILDVKKGKESSISEINIEDIISKILNRLEFQISESGIDINYSVNFQNIVTVGPYFESIMYNLISNAIKYRDKDKENSYLKINVTEKDKEHIEISVEDNGLGIDLDSNKEKVFGLYKRFHLHIEGKGMGLYLTKTQTDAIHGNIKVSSEVGIGTVFIIELPKSIEKMNPSNSNL